MKYFTVSDPYLALIKASDESEAISLYVRNVADNIDGEVDKSIKKISRDHALILFSQVVRNDYYWMPKKILSIFEKKEPEILGVDPSLC